MTEPPAAPPPPDPTADPSPFSTPHSPPYPAEGGGYPTYQPGSAPVGPPPTAPLPAYPPVTAVPAYGQGPATGASRLTIGLAVTLALAILACGVIGLASFVLLGDHRSGGASEPVAVGPSQAPTEAPGQAVPTWFPTDFPSLFPLPGAPGGKSHGIVYEVTGDAHTADVAYLGADDVATGTEQVNLPWRKEVTSRTGMLAVSLMAISPTGETVSCRISVDGRQVAADSGDAMVLCIGVVR